MSLYLRTCKSGGSKKSWTSKTTSHGTSDSLHIGLDLNNEAVDLEDVEVQEVRHMGRDMSKKKASSSIARSESSTAAGEAGLVNALLNKWSHIARTQHRELEAQRIAHERQQLEFERERERTREVLGFEATNQEAL
uniref:Uncharacterized protein n=1 Tax=Tanacetum cinerariifolium TaxID=118510 RepID=A0A6L2NRB2_TANCI|nr:hypothetical protein [Tanacetum cinerariifolium]